MCPVWNRRRDRKEEEMRMTDATQIETRNGKYMCREWMDDVAKLHM